MQKFIVIRKTEILTIARANPEVLLPLKSVLRSRNYFGSTIQCYRVAIFLCGSERPRSQSRLRFQAKRAAPAPATKIFHFNAENLIIIKNNFWIIMFF